MKRKLVGNIAALNLHAARVIMKNLLDEISELCLEKEVYHERNCFFLDKEDQNTQKVNGIYIHTVNLDWWRKSCFSIFILKKNIGCIALETDIS